MWVAANGQVSGIRQHKEARNKHGHTWAHMGTRAQGDFLVLPPEGALARAARRCQVLRSTRLTSHAVSRCTCPWPRLGDTSSDLLIAWQGPAHIVWRCPAVGWPPTLAASLPRRPTHPALLANAPHCFCAWLLPSRSWPSIPTSPTGWATKPATWAAPRCGHWSRSEHILTSECRCGRPANGALSSAGWRGLESGGGGDKQL